MSFLYTPVPAEDLFAHENAGELVEVDLGGGRRLLVRPVDHKSGTVVGLVSTDPADYIQSQWQPGTVVRLP